MATKTFKYRLYLSSAQRTAMRKTLDACRWVYNKVLEARRGAWEERKESLSLYDTINMLPGWKEEHPWLKQAHSQVLQEVCFRVHRAFQNFFRRMKQGEKPGYPRFKGKGWYKSFTYPQSGFKLHDDGKKLYLSKIGDVKIKLHRPIEGEVKRLVIKRDALGKWYACFVVGFEPEPLPPSNKVTGVDVGLRVFATLSNGEKIPNPRFFEEDEKELAKAQRKLSECEKGTPKYRKCKGVVQHIYERIANRRKDFLHKLSRWLVNEFQIIAFEDLDISDMKNGNWRSLNRSIGDAAWGQLVRLTCEKAEWAARTVITVDPCNTSKICSGCGELVEKDLSECVHRCPHCGLHLDRDVNAARNILARGLACMGQIPRSSTL